MRATGAIWGKTPKVGRDFADKTLGEICEAGTFFRPASWLIGPNGLTAPMLAKHGAYDRVYYFKCDSPGVRQG